MSTNDGEAFRVAVAPQATERFDDKGGAIATWIREIYMRIDSAEGKLVVPHSPQKKVGKLEVFQSRLYDAYDSIARAIAAIIVSTTSREYVSTLTSVLLKDAIWKRIILRESAGSDIVHLHNRPHYASFLREHGYSGKIVLHMHNDLTHYITADEWGRVSPLIDSTFFCSQYMLNAAVASFGGTYFDNHGHVLYNGVNVRAEDAEPISRDESLILCAGRVREEKGVVEAILICDELSRRGTTVALEIVGGTASGMENPETPYLRKVRSLADEVNARWGREVVRLCGPLPHPALLDRMAAASMLLVPARWEEPFGMVAIEAMSVGTLPIVPNRGGLPEVVGAVGLVVPYSSQTSDQVKCFADSIEPLLRAGVVSSVRQSLRKRAQLFDWDVIARHASALLSSINEG